MIAKTVTGIFILVFLNILFLFYTMVLMRRQEKKMNPVCSFRDYTNAISVYMHENKLNQFYDKLPVICKNQQYGPALEVFHASLTGFLESCSHRRPMPKLQQTGIPILTLFSTWKSSKEKEAFYFNTLENWSSFLPKINLVLFTNDTYFQQEATSRGWTVLPIVHHNADGVPVLKQMFKTVTESFKSKYYGYCNGDVLFVDNLLDTLTLAHEEFKDKNVFFTGRRTNIQQVTKTEMSSYDNLKMAAKKRGELFTISAEDYFITTKSFPWDDVPPLIVASPVYDNYLVATARCKHNFQTFDLTNTVLAIHQTTKAGNSEGHHHKFANYNHKLLENMKIRNLWLIYSRGYVTCTTIYSIYNLCGDIEFIRRKDEPGCKCF